MKDEVINLRCDACGEMNRDISYNPEYKTGFWCVSCGHSNDIKVMYYSRKNPNQKTAPLNEKPPKAGQKELGGKQ